MKLVVSDSKVELGRRAAAEGAALIRQAIAERGAANVIVATGASQSAGYLTTFITVPSPLFTQ